MSESGQASELKIFKTQKKRYKISLSSDYTAFSDYIYNFTVSNGKNSTPVINKEWQGKNGAPSGYASYLIIEHSDTADIEEGRYSLAEIWFRDSNSDTLRLWPIDNKEGHVYILPSAKTFST